MTYMKNVNFLVKLRRLVKSLAISFSILMIAVLVTAFNADAHKEPTNNPKESGQTKSGFKSLFTASSFDPTQSYVTQINPKAVPFVQNYIQERSEEMEKMKVWGKPYFDMYDGILARYGLPKELKYLSVIESSLKPNLVSVAGAKGPWQLMAAPARELGLRVTGKVDERTNYQKSTHAAAKMLKSLYNQFNDWLLVIAAYNCGPGRLRQAIKKAGSNDFWDLQRYLPLETRNHVKKFIGTHYIFEGGGGLTTMTAEETEQANMQDFVSAQVEDLNTSLIEVSGKYNSLVLAKQLDIDYNEFNKMNPQFDKLLSSGNKYNLRLPNEKVAKFRSQKNEILKESVQFLLTSGSALSAGK